MQALLTNLVNTLLLMAIFFSNLHNELVFIMANKKTAERQLAWLKFLHEGKTQHEIASDLGIAPRTVNTWAREDKWAEKRNMLQNTDENAAAKLSGYIAALYTSVDKRDEISRFPTPSEADSLNKMIAARERLMRGVTLNQFYEAAMMILKRTEEQDLTTAKKLATIIDELLKEEAEKIKR